MIHTKSARKFIEQMYIGKCKIVVSKKVVKPNHSTSFEDVVLAEDIPCKLSCSTPNSASDSNTITSVSTKVKLFINPDIEIPAGSKIEVTQNGKITNYKNTGEVALFETHQEIKLNLADEYS